MNRITRAAAALGVRKPKNIREKLAKIVALLITITALSPTVVDASVLSTASMSLTDPRPSTASVGYDLTASSFTNASIKCIKLVFATTSTGSTKPTGMVTASGITIDTSSSLLASEGSWSRGGADPDGTVTFTNGTGETVGAGGTYTYKLDGFTNSSAPDTAFFARFSTFDNVDCATTPRDNVTVEYILTLGSTLSLTIDNTLSFSVAGHTNSLCMTGVTATVDNSAAPNTIPFGSVTTNAIACQVLSAATNATNGFTIYIRDTGQLANTLSQQIPDVGSSAGSYTNGNTNAAPGSFTNNTTVPPFNQGAYGYTTDDATLGVGTADRFTNGGQKWASYGHGASTTNAEIAYEAAGVTSSTYTIAHQVGITSLTQPGSYSTIVIYTCTPVY